MEYEEFLESKSIVAEPCGFEPESALNSNMFPFQHDITKWALRRGRSAIWADCGLGKSICELEWSQKVHEHTKGNVLLLTPIAVGHQMIREGKKFGIPTNLCRSSKDIKPGINITNYEKLHHFSPESFSGICADESSILKDGDAATCKAVIEFAQRIPYRLAATATPSPNDLIETVNHSEYLNVMKGKEIKACFFIQDGNTTQKWRLKGHAKDPFWRWLASWAVAIRKPSDLGYDDSGFNLPPLTIHSEVVESRPMPGEMFVREAQGLNENRTARRTSLSDRVKRCAEIAMSFNEPFVAWCDLNAESEALVKAIPGSVEISGSMSDDQKERAILGFLDGSIQRIVTKPSLTGHGLNLQHCCKTACVGLGYSFEMFYQLIRRFYRFGQLNPVDVYVITSEAEGGVVKAIERKEKQATDMFDSIIKNMSGFSIGRSERDVVEYNPQINMRIPDWMPNPRDPWHGHRVNRPRAIS